LAPAGFVWGQERKNPAQRKQGGRGVHGDEIVTRRVDGHTARSALVKFLLCKLHVLRVFSVLKPLLSMRRASRTDKRACRGVRPKDRCQHTRHLSVPIVNDRELRTDAQVRPYQIHTSQIRCPFLVFIGCRPKERVFIGRRPQGSKSLTQIKTGKRHGFSRKSKNFGCLE
jgi:hypothetical protein